MSADKEYAAAVDKAACGWVTLVAYHRGTDQEMIEDCQTVVALLASRLEKPAAAVYRDVYEAYVHLPKPQILQLLTLMEIPGTLNT